MISDDASSFWIDQQPALRDFVEVYETHHAEVLAQMTAAAEQHAEFAPLLRAMSSSQREASNLRSRDLLRRAIDGDWEPYEAQLRAQGAGYAQMGVSFSGWYVIVGAFQRHLVPLLIAAYGPTPHRLAAALSALQAVMDRAMVLIAEEYLRTKEKMVIEQRELARQSGEVLDLLVDGVALFDPDGRYLHVNPAYERMTGMPLADLRGSRPVHPRQRPPLRT